MSISFGISTYLGNGNWVFDHEDLVAALVNANRDKPFYGYRMAKKLVEDASKRGGFDAIKTLAENNGLRASAITNAEGSPLWWYTNNIEGATSVSAEPIYAGALEAEIVTEGGVEEIALSPLAEVTTDAGTTLAGGGVQTLAKALPVIGAIATGIGMGYQSYKEHPEAWTDLSNATFDTPFDFSDDFTFINRLVHGEYSDEYLSYARENDVAKVVKAFADRGALDYHTEYRSQVTEAGVYTPTLTPVVGRTPAYDACMEVLHDTYPNAVAYNCAESIEYNLDGTLKQYVCTVNASESSTPTADTVNIEYDSTYHAYRSSETSLLSNPILCTVIFSPTAGVTYQWLRSGGISIYSGTGEYISPINNIVYITSGGLNATAVTVREDNEVTRAFPIVDEAVGLNIAPNTSLADIKTALQNAYPEWYDESFTKSEYNPYTDSAFDDRYLPLAMPKNDPYTDNSPDSGYDQQTAQKGKIETSQQAKHLTEDNNKVENSTPVVTPTPTPNDAGGGSVGGRSNALWSVYNPSFTELDQLGQFLWSDNIVDILKTFLNNPVDAIISLHMVYCTPATGTPQPIYLGYINTLVHSHVVTEQFKTIDCGTVDVAEYFKDARDYSEAYTRIEIYLPFIGIKQLRTADIIGGKVQVVYTIDVYTGALLCKIFVTKLGVKQLLYNFSGNCSVQVPLTGADRTRLLSGAITGALGYFTGGAAGAVVGAVAGGLMQGSTIDRSGQLGANSGALGVKTPYIIITRNYGYDAGDYNKFYGFPSNNRVALLTCKGYTRVKDVHVDIITTATENEKREIETLLKSGVIIN